MDFSWTISEPAIIVAIISSISLVFLYLFYFFGKMYEFSDGYHNRRRKFTIPTTREDYIITGFHFFSLYVALPLAFLFFFYYNLADQNISVQNKILLPLYIITFLILFLILVVIIFFRDKCINACEILYADNQSSNNNQKENTGFRDLILIYGIISVLSLVGFIYIFPDLFDYHHYLIIFQILMVLFFEQMAQETDLSNYFKKYVHRELKCITGCCVLMEQNYCFKYLIIPLVLLFEYPTFIFACELYCDNNLLIRIYLFASIVIVFLGLPFLAISLGKFHKKALPEERSSKF